MLGFYWLVEGTLAGCPRPGGFRSARPGPAEPPDDGPLDADLAALRERGIGALVTLTEAPLPDGAAERHDLVALHLPVDDLHPPTPDQFLAALRFIDRQRVEGRAVAVHCKVGQGRTGTVLAAYLIRAGRPADEAIAAVRAACPGAIGSPTQEAALAAFAARRDWIV
jgi:atypical dual specificity phosphatase